MNLTLKNLISKKQKTQVAQDASPAGTSVNPYLNARRTWNSHTASVVSFRHVAVMLSILSLLIALGAVGGLIHIGSKSKFIPYVVEIDKLGQAQAAGPIYEKGKADPRVVHTSVSDFISNARLVTPDVALQRQAIFKTYAALSPNDPATQKMNEFMNSTPESKPMTRATKEMVNIDITSVIPQTADTWQVDWIEKTRDRQGTLKTETTWRALVTVYEAEPNPSLTEKQMRQNPLSIFVRDFSWSRLH